MKRRKAIGGILAFAGIGVTSFAAKEFFQIRSSVERGQLYKYSGLIAELVDVIIPPSDTPGAKEAEVHEYIIDFMESCASKKEYTNFFNGLSELREACLNDYGTRFEECTMEKKIKIIKGLADSDFSNAMLAKIDAKLRGRSFFKILRALTIEGYCTSRAGVTELLAYQPIPARYEAITNIKPNQRAWATS